MRHFRVTREELPGEQWLEQGRDAGDGSPGTDQGLVEDRRGPGITSS